jgi:hypothetical protein
MMPAEKVGAVDSDSYLTAIATMLPPPGDRRTSRRLLHRLGPAIDQTWYMNTRLMNSRQSAGPQLIARTLSIFLRDKASGRAVVVTAECVMPNTIYQRDRADIDRMLQQLQVENKWPYSNSIR